MSRATSNETDLCRTFSFVSAATAPWPVLRPRPAHAAATFLEVRPPETVSNFADEVMRAGVRSRLLKAEPPIPSLSLPESSSLTKHDRSSQISSRGVNSD